MATTYSEDHSYSQDHGVTLSGDEARGGVTGHHVHQVLIAGLTGAVLGLAAVALYFGFDRVYASLAALFARNPIELMLVALPYALVAGVGYIVGHLLLKAWTALSGDSGDDSEAFMRFRVVTQFAVVCVLMAFYYMATN